MSHQRSKDELRVVKRDGSIEPFMTSKILSCIFNGLEATGEASELTAAMARGLGEAVTEYLHSISKGSTIPSRQLVDLVDLVLSQTGHCEAAMAIRHHANLRDRRRKVMMVATPRPTDGRFVQKRWDKSLIVQHLKRQHQLDAPTSRMMASRVEQLVFNCGLRVVTAGLVREMVRSELLAWGLMPGALVVKRVRHERTNSKGKVKDHTDPANPARGAGE